MIDVTLLGTGGMMPLPSRALTSLYVRYDGHCLLVDCGEGTQTAIRSAKLRINPIDAILITHFHADHISGLPGLLLSLGNEARTEPITIYGPYGLEKIVNSLRVIAPDLPFEINFCEFDPKKEIHFSCIGLEVDTIPLSHRIPCVGYKFSLERIGKFNPERAKEKGIPINLWGRLQRGEAVDGFCPEDVLGEKRRGLSLLYATDTRPVDGIRFFGKDVDLMILEGMFGEEEKLDRAIEAHHMLMREAAEIARDASASELWLTHFSPATPEPKLFEEELKEIFPNTVIGTDGLSRTLIFVD